MLDYFGVALGDAHRIGGFFEGAALEEPQFQHGAISIALMLASDYPISMVCEVLDYPRSSFYYEAAPLASEEQTLKEAVSRLAEAWPTYGYRRITAQLQREGLSANSKRIRRIMHELGLASQPSKQRIRTTNSLHDFAHYPNLVAGLQVGYPDQVWVGPWMGN